MPGIWQHDIARIMAVCDLDSRRVQDAKTFVNAYYTDKTGKPYEGVTGYANYHELLANKDCQRDHLRRLQRGGRHLFRHHLGDAQLGLRHSEPSRERVDHGLVGVRQKAVQDLLDLSRRSTLARQHAGGRDPFPLRLSEGLDRRGEELPRLARAQGVATCSGSRPLALSLSMG